MKLEISASQKWILLKALLEFTSDEQSAKFQEEYPDLDVDAFSEDIGSLVTKISELKYE